MAGTTNTIKKNYYYLLPTITTVYTNTAVIVGNYIVVKQNDFDRPISTRVIFAYSSIYRTKQKLQHTSRRVTDVHNT